MTLTSTADWQTRLQAILDTMDGFPILRRNDFGWIMRNIAISFGAHPDCMEARDLAMRLLRVQRKLEEISRKDLTT